jgi:hypothetical protein
MREPLIVDSIRPSSDESAAPSPGRVPIPDPFSYPAGGISHRYPSASHRLSRRRRPARGHSEHRLAALSSLFEYRCEKEPAAPGPGGQAPSRGPAHGRGAGKNEPEPPPRHHASVISISAIVPCARWKIRSCGTGRLNAVARGSPARLVARDRWIESTSLQRRASNEPCGCRGRRTRVGPRVRSRFAPAKSRVRTWFCRRDVAVDDIAGVSQIGDRAQRHLLDVSLGIGATGSHVPYERQRSNRAVRSVVLFPLSVSTTYPFLPFISSAGSARSHFSSRAKASRPALLIRLARSRTVFPLLE